MSNKPGAVAIADPNFIFEYLKQVETLADDVLTDRRDIIELNKKRDKAREAVRALKKNETDKNATVCLGNLFVQFPKNQAVNILEKDHSSVDIQIRNLEKGLKIKVNKLYEAEQRPELKGLNLVPLSNEERESLFNIINKE